MVKAFPLSAGPPPEKRQAARGAKSTEGAGRAGDGPCSGPEIARNEPFKAGSLHCKPQRAHSRIDHSSTAVEHNGGVGRGGGGGGGTFLSLGCHAGVLCARVRRCWWAKGDPKGAKRLYIVEKTTQQAIQTKCAAGRAISKLPQLPRRFRISDGWFERRIRCDLVSSTIGPRSVMEALDASPRSSASRSTTQDAHTCTSTQVSAVLCALRHASSPGTQYWGLLQPGYLALQESESRLLGFQDPRVSRCPGCDAAVRERHAVIGLGSCQGFRLPTHRWHLHRTLRQTGVYLCTVDAERKGNCPCR